MKHKSILEQLSTDERATVLGTLLQRHPKLRAEAAEIARGLMTDVDFETISDEVAHSLGALDLEALNSRAGGALVRQVQEKHGRKYKFMRGFDEIAQGRNRPRPPSFIDKARKRWPKGR